MPSVADRLPRIPPEQIGATRIPGKKYTTKRCPPPPAPGQKWHKSKVGSTKMGAPGGQPGGTIDVCAFAVAQNFARVYGCDMADAYRAVLSMGLAMHQLLLRGEPIGIPHVGVLYVGRKLCASYMGAKKGFFGTSDPETHKPSVRKNGLAPHGWEPAARFRNPHFVNCIRVFQPQALREYMRDHMPRNGTKVQQIKKARERFRTVLRRTGTELHRGEIAHAPRKKAYREHRKRLALL